MNEPDIPDRPDTPARNDIADSVPELCRIAEFMAVNSRLFLSFSITRVVPGTGT
jgi:hypothetical protein